MHCGKNLRGDAAVVAWVRYKNPRALPSFPAWEGILATETSDPGIIDGVFFQMAEWTQ